MDSRNTLSMLVIQDQEYAEFIENFSFDVDLSSAEEEQLASQALGVIEVHGSEEQKEMLQDLATSEEAPKSVGVDIAVLVAVTFLLRTHLKLHRNQEGKWEFLAEHKPSDNDLMGSLLTKLQTLLAKR